LTDFWARELGRFAVHAALAAAALWTLLVPARPLVARFVAAVAASSVVHPAYDVDVREYCDKAAVIARDGNPRAQETRWNGERFYRTLGWSLPLAGWYRVTGMPETPQARVRSAQALEILAACGTTALLLALGRRLGRETAGRLAALLYATFLPAVVYALIPFTETWTTFLVVASAYLFERLRAEEGPRAALVGAAFGLLQGLVLITRTELFFMPLVAAALLLREKRARALAPIAAGLALLAVPFVVNHEMRDGYPGHLRTSVQGGRILYFGNNPIEVNGQGNATPAVNRRVYELYAEDATGGKARDEAVAWMKAHPLAAVANAPKKLHFLWLAEPQGFTWELDTPPASAAGRVVAAMRHAAWVQSLVLLALGLVALKRGFVPRFWAALLVLHALVWCVLAASQRNRYPLEPFLMLGAAAWFAERSKDARGATRAS
jgi:4-amino-4-deoxy-L-arabinose transferase-like glycosyltransferase